ncbi:MAG: RNA-binding S4 domain-containing protein [Anaerorhabdus sp.]
MRVDKYLKVSRILKRRSVSKELALHQRIEVNGKLVKPSYHVEIGDEITITYGRRQMSVKVLELTQQVKKQEATDMYEVISEAWIEEE